MSFTLTDYPDFLWQKMSLSNIFYFDLLLLNNLMIIFLKLKKNKYTYQKKKKKYTYHRKNLKCLKLQLIQLLEAVVSSLTDKVIIEPLEQRSVTVVVYWKFLPRNLGIPYCFF